NFLYLDDNIYLPRAALGAPAFPLPGIAGYVMIAVLGATGSVIPAKLMNVIFLSAVAALSAACAAKAKVAVDRWFSALLAALIATFPIAVEMGFFVSGAHPLMGGTFALCSLLRFMTALHDDRSWGFHRNIAATLVLSILAAFFSPSMTLMPLAPAIWIFVAWAFGALDGCTVRATMPWALLPGCLIVVLLTRSHHYAGLTGWVDY